MVQLRAFFCTDLSSCETPLHLLFAIFYRVFDKLGYHKILTLFAFYTPSDVNCPFYQLEFCIPRHLITIIVRQFNQKLSKKNTSGIRGVYWIEQNKIWRAQIIMNKTKLSLGCFENIEDALQARQTKAKELFGDFINACEK